MDLPGIAVPMGIFTHSSLIISTNFNERVNEPIKGPSTEQELNDVGIFGSEHDVNENVITSENRIPCE